jgi:hypothetical protein
VLLGETHTTSHCKKSARATSECCVRRREERENLFSFFGDQLKRAGGHVLRACLPSVGGRRALTKIWCRNWKVRTGGSGNHVLLKIARTIGNSC